mgnify:FL=1
MSENKKLELLDQYDDVTFALLMDEYAEEEGARLRKEFEEAQAAGEVTDTSDALDEKCLQMIHRDYAKKRGKDNVRKIIRMTSKVAVAVMVFLGVMTTAVMSVDAFRLPVLSYLIEQHEKYSAINFGEHDSTMPEKSEYEDPITQFVPNDYISVFYKAENGYISSLHENDHGDRINFDMCRAHAEYRFDTEDAICENTSIVGYDAILAIGDPIVLVWYDDISGTVYNLSATNLTKEQLVALAQNIMLYLQKG